MEATKLTKRSNKHGHEKKPTFIRKRRSPVNGLIYALQGMFFNNSKPNTSYVVGDDKFRPSLFNMDVVKEKLGRFTFYKFVKGIYVVYNSSLHKVNKVENHGTHIRVTLNNGKVLS